ncbi:replicative DNA helicase [Marinactinospora thermotolerans]|uniref:Replicative DNA helicase n=1 Tax=Marinactinospora thermotolerans DSM 45154 TaxID=1122192 RepID=A0A1T4RC87_9ACTN|nr:replicative DNA helicase [Marinactinospora thermotolerans]SKA13672.1 replicative DNA helicase [Marinactinospora thermotolerans DSM 45154]
MSDTEGPREESGFERTPPNDIMAEQCVLGGMLLSKEAISQVVEIVRSADFYRPAHQTIYDTIIDLFSRGEPVDAVSVNAELTKRGEITRVGGAPYLHTLTEAVPTAANAGYYARIVADRAVLRRLVEAGTRIAQIGYAGDGEVDDLVDRAQAEIYRVAEKRTGEDYLPLSEIMPGALDEIEAISAHDGSLTGVPTGFTDFDALSNGLHPGQMIIIAARPAVGKALALDTPLPTPDGWTTMGRVRTGDLLVAADGTPTRVVATTEVMHGRPCYEITFDDGTTVIADAEHQWPVSAPDRPVRVRTTRELATSLEDGLEGRPAIALAAPLDLPERDLALPPYFLGAWLGGGHPAMARIACPNPEVRMGIEASGLVTKPVGVSEHCYDVVLPWAEAAETTARLTRLGVVDEPHLPVEYLRSSPAQRRSLLAGLLDTGGAVDEDGAIRLPVGTRRLARDVRDLVHGLGYRTASLPARRGGQGREHVVVIRAPRETFPVGHGPAAHHGGPGEEALAPRVITGIRPVPSVPVRCVQVDHPDHLYLATEAMVPTHNSTLALDFARAAAIKHQLTTVFFSLEMGRNEIVMRLLSAEARVPLHTMRSGLMTDDDWTRLARRMGEVASAPLFIDDSPNMSMMEIRAKCRRLKQQHDLKLVVVDYLQLMSSSGRVESRQQEVSEMSRSLKLLAKELEVPVIALSQLNRGPEQRTDKKPQVSDLRESGSIEQDADMVILLYREDVHEKESPRAGEADLIVAKHRNGPTATVTVAFQGHYSRFVDMAPG